MRRPVFKFIVHADGTLSKYPDYAWHFGKPGNKSIIQLVNEDFEKPHSLEMVSFIHKQTGKPTKPLRGLRRLRARKGEMVQIEVTPKEDRNKRYGTHLYWTSLDGKEPNEDPEIIVDDPDLLAHRFHHDGSADFEFHIDDRGVLTKVPDLPWEVGEPGTEISIRLVNNHDRKHVVRMVRFKHKASGRFLDPLTGTKAWVALRNSASHASVHKVKDNGRYGRYVFLTSVDGVDGTDPEIIVDDPPR
jgi:hypothetical protein